MKRHLREKRQRCPRCGEWLRAESVARWEKHNKGDLLGFLRFPKEIEGDAYVCPQATCGYTTEVLGSDNRRIQLVLKDILHDFLTDDELRRYASQSHNNDLLEEMFMSLAHRLQIQDNMNALAALLIGVMSQDLRDEIVAKTAGLPVDQVMAKIEELAFEKEPEYNFGDLVVALTL